MLYPTFWHCIAWNAFEWFEESWKRWKTYETVYIWAKNWILEVNLIDLWRQEVRHLRQVSGSNVFGRIRSAGLRKQLLRLRAHSDARKCHRNKSWTSPDHGQRSAVRKIFWYYVSAVRTLKTLEHSPGLLSEKRWVAKLPPKGCVYCNLWSNCRITRRILTTTWKSCVNVVNKSDFSLTVSRLSL